MKMYLNYTSFVVRKTKITTERRSPSCVWHLQLFSLVLLCFPRWTTSEQSVVTSMSIKSIITAFPVFVKLHLYNIHAFKPHLHCNNETISVYILQLWQVHINFRFTANDKNVPKWKFLISVWSWKLIKLKTSERISDSAECNV